MRDLLTIALVSGLLAPAACAHDPVSVDMGRPDLALAPDAAVTGDLAMAPADLARGEGDAAQAGCRPMSSSDLAGVALRLAATRCTFTLAEARAGIELRYDVVIEGNVTGVIAAPQDGGSCGRPGASGLIVFERLSGGGQSYCVCDEGRCVPPPQVPVTLAPGTFPASFRWDGLNWSGPSDTGNPKGAPFPVGTYTLEVSAVGTRQAGPAMTPFAVRMQVPVTLVP